MNHHCLPVYLKEVDESVRKLASVRVSHLGSPGDSSKFVFLSPPFFQFQVVLPLLPPPFHPGAMNLILHHVNINGAVSVRFF